MNIFAYIRIQVMEADLRKGGSTKGGRGSEAASIGALDKESADAFSQVHLFFALFFVFFFSVINFSCLCRRYLCSRGIWKLLREWQSNQRYRHVKQIKYLSIHTFYTWIAVTESNHSTLIEPVP